jgi:periplasmic divalent cation tolerance protein
MTKQNLLSAHKNYLIVFVTTPSVRISRQLAHQILKSRLAACVNYFSGIQSIYPWQGRLTTSRESLMLIKTHEKCWTKLKNEIQKYHPYQICEILAVSVVHGNGAYLKWVFENLKD